MININNLWKHRKLLRNNFQIVPRVVQDYYRLLVLKQPVLRKVDIAVIAGCNAKCPFCFAATLENEEGPQLSLPEIQGIVTEAVKLGAIAVEFIGGEPLMCRHLADAVRFARRQNVLTSTTTNGLLLTHKKIHELNDAGLNVIQISLDSADHREHDASRGVPGCYAKIMQAIEWIRETDIELMLSTVATNENLSNDGVMKVVKFAEHLDVPITVNPASKAGGWKGNANVLLTDENRRRFEQIVQTSHARWAGQVNFLKEGCPCGKEVIYVTAYGHVIPCGFIQISYGNIRQEPLTQIWDRMQEHRLMQEDKNTCIAAFDKAFIKDYIDPLDRREDLPVYIHDHPTYKQKVNG
ncbi:MAG: radical SAM protein [Candidatus Omnitrophica bacterium]|nr:radical SAM protein [Candidatus Omnitrophota bacterium]MCB9719851.1 radical SAM protein [Candidatus Omnitrophota bacterium]